MGSQRIFSASFAILSELCGQKPFACGQQNPLTAKNAKISARRSRRKTTLHRYSLLEATSQGAFFATFAKPWRVSAVKSFLPVDAKQFSREEKPTRPTGNLPAPRGARPGSSRAAWRRSALERRELATA